MGRDGDFSGFVSLRAMTGRRTRRTSWSRMRAKDILEVRMGEQRMMRSERSERVTFGVRTNDRM
jgi:hypothetical protein